MSEWGKAYDQGYRQGASDEAGALRAEMGRLREGLHLIATGGEPSAAHVARMALHAAGRLRGARPGETT